MRRAAITPLVALGLLIGGCATPEARRPDASSVARFYLEARPGEAVSPVALPVSGVTLDAQPLPVLIESDLAGVAGARVELGECLLFRFKPAASADLFRLSTAARGRRLILTVDGVPLGARRLDATLAHGELLMFVEVPPRELPSLVHRLEIGIARLAQAASAPVQG